MPHRTLIAVTGLVAALALAGNAQRNTPRERPSPGCTTTKVFEVYSVCDADGFWHVVTDELYLCPRPGLTPTTQSVRVHDIRTKQECREGAQPPAIRQISPWAEHQLADGAGAVDGTFVMRECLSDGRWYRVTYNRLSTPAGVRLDPRPVNYEDTGELCTPPPDARAPHAALATPATDTRVAQTPSTGGKPIDALVRDVEAALASAQASLPPGAKPPAAPAATTLPSATLVLEPGTEPRRDESRIAQLGPRAGAIVALGLLALPEKEFEELVEQMQAWEKMPRFGVGGGMQQLDPPSVNLGDVDTEMQEESILDEIEEKLVIASGTAGTGTRSGLLALFRSPFAVLHADEQSTGGLKVLFTSLGVSSGEAFDVQAINTTGKPVEFKLASMVLRPLKKAAGERIAREFAKASGKTLRVRMLGYCMQFLKLPPKAGTIFVAAPPQVQEQFAPARTIFNAARALHGRGYIKPPGAANPQAYFHSIRQWAWWTREQKFTEPAFTSAMLDYTKKNLANAGQPWTKEAEAYVRATAPKRWADIGSVLGLADRFTARKGGR